MNPVRITSTAITVLQMRSSILHICYNTRVILGNKPWALCHVQDEVTVLRADLESVLQLAIDSDGSSGHGKQKAVVKLLAQSQSSRGPLVLCLGDMHTIEHKLLARYTREPMTKIHAVFRAMPWDLSEKEIEPVPRRLSQSKATLNLAISTDGVTLLLELQKTSSSMADDIQKMDRNLDDLTLQLTTRSMSGQRPLSKASHGDWR
ncbi:hypothetical protein F4780DRAFT_573078 [Xylariomycetidae sp. FL0641]|nr:hypothetical protein F4780DRAFT_573078 [Xylariomycetidae sp. FL0641]